MNIGIDARLVHETGVGRYIRHLIQELMQLEHNHTFIVYTLREKPLPFSLNHAQWTERSVGSRWHTVQEQIELPHIYSQDHLDVLHVPYFTVPLFYSGRVVTTLHDLTILRVTTGKASTLPLPLYLLKKAGYRIVLQEGLKKATDIICVSESTREDAIHTCNIPKEKTTVTYEGVDPLFFSSASASPLEKPYVLYVGNAYPHKNLDILIQAAQRLKDQLHKHCTIVCIGPDDYFYAAMRQTISGLQLEDYFYFPKNIDDHTLHAYYAHACATISPSFAEGFALPPLEALAADSPLIVSDIPAFRELLPSHVLYLPVDDVQRWADSIVTAVSAPRTKFWVSENDKRLFFSKYSWKSMAQKTLAVYESKQI